MPKKTANSCPGATAQSESHQKNAADISQIGTVWKESASESKRNVVIDIDASDSDSDIQEVSQKPVTALQDKVNKHRAEASSIQLNSKKDLSSGSITASEFLKRSKTAHSIAVDPKKNAPILFRCELVLHGETGKKIGTRVPSQSRTFNVTEASISTSAASESTTKYWL